MWAIFLSSHPTSPLMLNDWAGLLLRTRSRVLLVLASGRLGRGDLEVRSALRATARAVPLQQRQVSCPEDDRLLAQQLSRPRTTLATRAAQPAQRGKELLWPCQADGRLRRLPGPQLEL